MTSPSREGMTSSTPEERYGAAIALLLLLLVLFTARPAFERIERWLDTAETRR